ncbi:MAG TPA: FAD-dependent thymidylate synthase [Terriglobales bacterium]|nr:FAD-dependent thymidylate synthase [Terriglobales bacterium]
MSEPAKPSPEVPRPEPATSTEVYAVHGAEPEVQAYAMAKYSRSALSMKESLREISQQKAEKFLNTFYFQYGHRSIADLAHIALAVERLSILAAIALVDEQRWDGQERSTRYQDFRKSGYYVPEFGGNAEAVRLYREAMDKLFAEYDFFSNQTFEHLRDITPRPPEMKPEAYERTLRARAFDVSRYLLPLATNTSLGEIVNARTLESQVARLLSHTHPEVRRLGGLLKEAALNPAYNVNQETWRALVEQIRSLDSELGDRAAAELLKPVRVAPTLVKYADPNNYEVETRRELRKAAVELMRNAPVDPVRSVELLDDDPLEVELATTLLYEYCNYPYRQIRAQVEPLSGARRQELIDLGLRHRGPHDELLRPFAAGQRFRFDILMDIGGFRDMHRHRRCVQIMQGFTFAHGFDMPPEIEAAGLTGRYQGVMKNVTDAAGQITSVMSKASGNGVAESPEAEYLVPLAYRKRTLFKMDFAEALYIAELRTTPAGHVSYRKVAYAMFEEVASKYPALTKYFRVKDVQEPVDLLKR